MKDHMLGNSCVTLRWRKDVFFLCFKMLINVCVFFFVLSELFNLYVTPIFHSFKGNTYININFCLDVTYSYQTLITTRSFT